MTSDYQQSKKLLCLAGPMTVIDTEMNGEPELNCDLHWTAATCAGSDHHTGVGMRIVAGVVLALVGIAVVLVDVALALILIGVAVVV